MPNDPINIAIGERFLFDIPDDFFDSFRRLEQMDTPLIPVILAFHQNLASAIQVGSIPFQLVRHSVLTARFSQLHTAERIRALKTQESGEVPNKGGDSLALEVAQARIREELSDPKHVQQHAQETLNHLGRHLEDEVFTNSSKELMRQVLVLTWSAFEILSNDLVRIMLNHRASLFFEIAEIKRIKDSLGTRNIWDALEKYRFDLSSNMGDVLLELSPMDSIEKIRETLLLLLDGDGGADLKDSRLWILSQQRHLIVHRRGLVDSRYLANTGDALTVGEQLTLNSSYIDQVLYLVRDIGCRVFEAATLKLGQ